ncbi:serine hydrolase [Streptomyces sp. NPDC046887]|uniref:serine hydrolase n=1 Tax=Streptomyces sp. NPDC046887 TaxID=3155472 RepID=UPI0033D73247
MLLPAAVAATATPAAAAADSVACTSKTPGLAAKLTKDITAAVKGRKGTIAVVVNDRRTKTSCTLRPDQKFDSASVVKTTVLATLLWDAQKTRRSLTATEKSRATAMITRSDNDSTSALWRQLGTTKITGFLKAAGMTKTVPGADGYWGLTQITARDQQVLLGLITAKNAVLTDASRAYILKLMNEVVADQRWGTPAGASKDARIHVKNGWLPRKTLGWRVHSIGAFSGTKHDHQITVLTHGNADWQAGINTIQAIAKVVHSDLAAASLPARSARRAHVGFVPPAAPAESIPATPDQPAEDSVTAPR